ncbi:hypothetical protein [uncultured Nonlabens sp.]|uniref:hypothetical protein n=1 Tax=uncultured Nonlabens sp. TaxID=859306 RepID=UPI002616B12A|nr:hypothetical protein [uncultured Nonlabens sp.]
MNILTQWQYLPDNGRCNECVKPEMWKVLLLIGSIVAIGLLYSFVIRKYLDKRND